MNGSRRPRRSSIWRRKSTVETDPLFPPIHVALPPAAVPGLVEQPDFVRTGATVNINNLDAPFGTSLGGYYTVSYDRYVDRDLDRYSFNRFRADFRQFIPIVNNARQLALRLHFDDLAPEAGQDVPFYMQPTLGGGYSLRSLPSYRLRDRSLVLFQAEYRIQANPFIDDRDFLRHRHHGSPAADLDLGNMTHDWGIGIGPATWRRPPCVSIWRSAKRDRGSCSSSPMHSERMKSGPKRPDYLRVRRAVVVLALAALLAPARAAGPRFYPDDPLRRDNDTALDASGARPIELSEAFDFLENMFADRGERRNVRASNVNTVDEVPDSSWFTNRIGVREMPIDEIVRGPDSFDRLEVDQWVIVSDKGDAGSSQAFALSTRSARGRCFSSRSMSRTIPTCRALRS